MNKPEVTDAHRACGQELAAVMIRIVQGGDVRADEFNEILARHFPAPPTEEWMEECATSIYSKALDAIANSTDQDHTKMIRDEIAAHAPDLGQSELGRICNRMSRDSEVPEWYRTRLRGTLAKIDAEGDGGKVKWNGTGG